MTTTALQLDALKTKQRAVWDLGDYPKVADAVIPHLGEVLVDACGVKAADRVLDVAAGAGNAALPAARRGAAVTASDLSEHLLDECAARARVEGLSLTCTPADAEALPFADRAFDVVLSCVGIMFTPNHQGAADELLRACRPGGRVGVLSWTPEGFIGQLFATMKPYAPPPPPGAQPPPLWGSADHVRGLLGDRVRDLDLTVGSVQVDAFDEPAGFRELFKHAYGPVLAVYRSIADDAERTRALDMALDELAEAHWSDGTMSWDYLLAVGSRAE